tara:strand:+ start:701 stop:883 length:183 start_codon:yes stop_codon:yes gene_type:complete
MTQIEISSSLFRFLLLLLSNEGKKEEDKEEEFFAAHECRENKQTIKIQECIPNRGRDRKE